MAKEFSIIILVFTLFHQNHGSKKCPKQENDFIPQNCKDGDIIARNICIPKSYDKVYPPDFPNLVMVGANFKELDIINIDIKNQVIRLGIDYAITWWDGRIKFFGNKTAIKTKMLEKDQTAKFWMPRLQVHKLIEANSYGVIGTTTGLYVSPGCNGEINTSPNTMMVYSSKNIISFACTMEFQNFPYDEQNCKLKVPSMFAFGGNSIITYAPSSLY